MAFVGFEVVAVDEEVAWPEDFVEAKEIGMSLDDASKLRTEKLEITRSEMNASVFENPGRIIAFLHSLDKNI